MWACNSHPLKPLGSAGLYLTSAIFDLAKAGSSTKRHNEKLASRHVIAAPIWVPEDEAVGVMVVIGI